jgi:hypothetical protein
VFGDADLAADHGEELVLEVAEPDAMDPVRGP